MIIGKILEEKYEIIEQIGQGGMAYVYKARDLRLDRFVAVKVLKNEFMENEEFLKKFLREAQADAKLAHPNIVNVYDVGIQDGYYYIVMEYIDGSTLKDYIKSKKRITAEETVTIISAVASGLAHAHNNNIIHRDVKPHNILLTSSKMAKVADFGIARAITSSTVTATEEALGSVHYISPEQARGGFLDARSDLYSLGIMMYEMLTGELPYDADTPVAVALKHVQNNVEAPSGIVKTIPENLNQIVLNLTRRKADDRYQSAEELLSDLKLVENDLNAPILPTYNTADHPAPKRTKKVANKKTKERKPIFKNKRMMTIFIICAVSLGVIASFLVVNYLVPKVTVPDVTGLSITDASLELEKLGLEYEINKEFNSEIAKNFVISQTPEKDVEIRTNVIVQLQISLGPDTATIPNVIGMSKMEAESTITNAGFVVKEYVYEYNDEYKKDIVYDQRPIGDIEAKEGTKIVLFISNGKDTVTMPKLTNYALNQAKSLIIENGLIVGTVTYASSESFEEGMVMQQTPAAFMEVDKDTIVDLVVSLGKKSSKTIRIDLSNHTSVDDPDKVLVRVDLMDADGSNLDTVYSESKDKNDKISVSMTGTGTKRYKIYIEGDLRATFEVSF